MKKTSKQLPVLFATAILLASFVLSPVVQANEANSSSSETSVTTTSGSSSVASTTQSQSSETTSESSASSTSQVAQAKKHLRQKLQAVKQEPLLRNLPR